MGTELELTFNSMVSERGLHCFLDRFLNISFHCFLYRISSSFRSDVSCAVNGAIVMTYLGAIVDSGGERSMGAKKYTVILDVGAYKKRGRIDE
ncbi:hypothetical protein QG37_06253 [Candidozyma auris]|nr:hypothetical protein QG37_06253 [[Candida] auris]